MGEPIVEWLNQQQDNMVELLRDLVDIDSNSFDKAGVDRVGARLTAFLMTMKSRMKPSRWKSMATPSGRWYPVATEISPFCYAAIATPYFQQVKSKNAPSRLPTARLSGQVSPT